MDDSEVLEVVGNYSLEQTDSFYAACSGCAFIVCWDVAFCHKQLHGFKASELEDAKRFLHEVAGKAKDDDQHKAMKAEVKDRIARGWRPVSRDDPELYRELCAKGFGVVEECKELRWMSK
jgi:hypothetical protein